ncbi:MULTISPECIES: sugar nucleotide-binding protein [unclassified Gordonia (in: high G+C Gram-positive bacteria)]|uniref:SDR family oxidoreductase n=1 Tax=unclassified Gordonia (in: high G+C Gram-positive bacteria) TaxID=2657482 RepID=UPI001F1192A5|nr:sugar nucleotide-binding protein [Gordonia sp. ABSL49_1]MCH5642107.1 sugar nucleotide-binding protein [Gordonia sp. ABSL49_1]
MKAVVFGATGTLGSALTQRLSDNGVDVVSASRASGVDAYRGEGLDAAIAGADVVVDCLNVTTMKAKEAVDFFTTAAGNVGRAAAAAGAPVVCLSIVNASDPAVNRKFGYYQGKAAQEEAYASVVAPENLTIVKSVQWYELAEQLLGMMRLGPIAAVPHMRARPAAAADVASVLADVVAAAQHKPADGVIEVAGPQVLDLVDVAKAIARQKGSPKWVVGIRFGGAAIRDGGLVPSAPDIVTPTGLDDWLAERSGPAATVENRR